MSQRSFWSSLRRHLTVKGLMLGAIALFLATVSVDAFFHDALAAELTDALLEISPNTSQADVRQTTVASGNGDLSSPQAMERLHHNGFTHGSLTRHHLTSAHLFTAL
ncbi:MAG: hypothetical protein HC812_17935 [Leptolyngbya sp. RL_3_1]|nr:hypothetical protein [Leptolyngbya sp. RL_3_1]